MVGIEDNPLEMFSSAAVRAVCKAVVAEERSDPQPQPPPPEDGFETWVDAGAGAAGDEEEGVEALIDLTESVDFLPPAEAPPPGPTLLFRLPLELGLGMAGWLVVVGFLAGRSGMAAVGVELL